MRRGAPGEEMVVGARETFEVKKEEEEEEVHAGICENEES